MKSLMQTQNRGGIFSCGILVLLGALITTGCNQNTKSGVTPNNQDRQMVQTVNANLFPVAGGYSAANGSIYTSTQYDQTFNQAVKWMVAAYIDPNQVGQVNPENGVLFRAHVETGGNNGVNTATSGFEVIINDSYALAGKNENGEPLEPIKMGAQAVSMTLGAPNLATVVFANDFGTYTFKGQYDNQYFQGTFHFQNHRSWNPAVEAVHDGDNIMGGFTIPTCSFFKCQ